MDEFKEKWNIFAVHTWLIMSSFGIMFAVLSFIQDLEKITCGLGEFDVIKYPWIKGILSFFLGIIFYFVIGIPHIYGARKIK